MTTLEPPTTLVPMPTMAEAIGDTWRAIRLQHRELPPVTLSIVPGRGSADGSVDWDQDAPVLLVGVRTVAKGPEEILGWLLHQAAHGLLAAREEGRADGKQGRYHSGGYQKAAHEVGLTTEYANPSWGWSVTRLGDDLGDRYKDQLRELEQAMADYQVPAPADRNGIVARCQCSSLPPERARQYDVIRVRGKNAADDLREHPVVCSACGQPFTP